MSSASDILTEAANLVAGDRGEQHGEKERSFVAIAAMWTAYLAARRDPTGPVRAKDVAHMMALLKQCRAEWGTAARDHWVDQCGYAAIAGELSLEPDSVTVESGDEFYAVYQRGQAWDEAKRVEFLKKLNGEG